MFDDLGNFPILIVCAVPLDIDDTDDTLREYTPLAIGDHFEERVDIDDTAVKVVIYQKRIIEIQDPVHELILRVTKTGHLTRSACLIVEFTDGRTEGYLMHITLESAVDNI